MNKVIKKVLVSSFFAFLLIFIQTKDAAAQKSQTNVYEAIARENTKSLNSADAAQGLGAFCAEAEKNGYKALLKSNLSRQMHPNEDNRQRLVLNLLSDFYNLSDFYDKNPAPHSTIMDETTWQDLNLLSGPKTNSRRHLAAEITTGRTITAIGTATIYRILVQPTAYASKLRTQQEITKELVRNEQLFNDLDAKLKELVIPENVLLSFWDPEDFFSIQSEGMKKKIPFDDKVAFFKKISEWINKSPLTMEAYGRTQDVFGYTAKLLMAYGAVALPIFMFSGYNIIPGLPAEQFNVMAPTTIMGVLCWAANNVFSQNIVSRITGATATYNYAEGSYYTVRETGVMNVIYECLHQKVSYVAKYLNNLKEMEKFIAQHPTLASKMPVVQNFSQTLNNLKKSNPDFGYLINLLQTNTLKGEYCWWEYFSRVMVAYKLMREQKEHFVNAMLAVGELDAQLTIAKLYKEFQNKPVTFCFPEFLDNSKNPTIIAQDFWNPFLNPEKAVPNSITIGHSEVPQNVIITGPNEGGKSTITKALIFGFILGQTLGIAPAKAMAFKPASTLMTYLNVVDDFAAEKDGKGVSHFKACVLRSAQLLDASKKLAPGEFGVFAVDEAFDGTAFKEAQACAFTLIEELGKNPNVMCITNTHFPFVTKLEEIYPSLFRNYKVSVIDVQGEKIVYPYKLELGISHQNVALKILKEEGFGEEFVRRAQDIVERD